MSPILARIAHVSVICTIAHAAEPSTSEATKESLVRAIKEHRVVTFAYQGQTRTVEPHACGVTESSGEAVLHGYQTTGGSASGTPPAWRTFSVARISDLVVTDVGFAAPRSGYTTGRPHLEPVWAEVTATKSATP